MRQHNIWCVDVLSVWRCVPDCSPAHIFTQKSGCLPFATIHKQTPPLTHYSWIDDCVVSFNVFQNFWSWKACGILNKQTNHESCLEYTIAKQIEWDSLWIKPTDALNSNFIGITTVYVSGSLSAQRQEFLAVHRLWYILCSCDEPMLPGAGWNCHCSSNPLLVANGHHNCIKCTKADVRLRTPDVGQKGCPKHIQS